ncbi:hypothetical protein [Cupriavidus pauculus]|uniref:Uncharacterized protein n=1 Tax=Cupriavidus pauculus TaxID=82633 RepID=A0A3G8H3S1_9BURK|nr:hypothetical protein [Cupriavidus pauculus]AZG14905.1 hypothetical protein EHF44_16590 [Cupriavidus pauculus]
MNTSQATARQAAHENLMPELVQALANLKRAHERLLASDAARSDEIRAADAALAKVGTQS